MIDKVAEETESPSGKVQAFRALHPSGSDQPSLFQDDQNNSPEYASDQPQDGAIDRVDDARRRANPKAGT